YTPNETSHSLFQHLYGSEEERLHTDSIYDLMFALNQYDFRTILTGGNFVYQNRERSAFTQKLSIRTNEDVPIYNNQDDVICELTMLVESATLPLKPVGRAAKRLLMDRSLNDEFALGHPNTSDKRTGLSSVTFRWHHVMPREEVGLHVSW